MAATEGATAPLTHANTRPAEHSAPQNPAMTQTLPAAQTSPTAPTQSDGERWKAWLIANHLPLGLLVMVALGYLWPDPGLLLAKTPLNTISIVGIFFISGLGLQTDEVKKAMRAYTAITFGVLSIMLVTPLLSFAVALLPLSPPDFSRGMALFMAMPTTISSGVIMTTEAKGNAALALLLSVSTNILAVFTVPLFAKEIFKEGTGGAGSPAPDIDAGALLLKLVGTILVPLLVGKALRRFAAVVAFYKKYKLQLKLTSSALLISVPWIMMSQSSGKLHSVSFSTIAMLIGLSLVLHVALLLLNYFGTGLFRAIALPERKAVVINASQKTINTAASVVISLPLEAGDPGLLILPGIIAHFVQTIIDSMIAARWKGQAAAAAAAAAAEEAAAPAGDSGIAAAAQPASGPGFATAHAPPQAQASSAGVSSAAADVMLTDSASMASSGNEDRVGKSRGLAAADANAAADAGADPRNPIV